MARGFVHPTAKEFKLDQVLHALADPIRRDIVQKLLNAKDGSLSCSGACGDLSPSTISFHYKILRESGLIASEKVGVSVLNTLRLTEMNKRFPGLIASILKHGE